MIDGGLVKVKSIIGESNVFGISDIGNRKEKRGRVLCHRKGKRTVERFLCPSINCVSTVIRYHRSEIFH